MFYLQVFVPAKVTILGQSRSSVIIILFTDLTQLFYYCSVVTKSPFVSFQILRRILGLKWRLFHTTRLSDVTGRP